MMNKENKNLGIIMLWTSILLISSLFVIADETSGSWWEDVQDWPVIGTLVGWAIPDDTTTITAGVVTATTGAGTVVGIIDVTEGIGSVGIKFCQEGDEILEQWDEELQNEDNPNAGAMAAAVTVVKEIGIDTAQGIHTVVTAVPTPAFVENIFGLPNDTPAAEIICEGLQLPGEALDSTVYTLNGWLYKCQGSDGQGFDPTQTEEYEEGLSAEQVCAESWCPGLGEDCQLNSGSCRCQPEDHCGNGEIEGNYGEECDGDEGCPSGSFCNYQCQCAPETGPGLCGNGQADPGEECGDPGTMGCFINSKKPLCDTSTCKCGGYLGSGPETGTPVIPGTGTPIGPGTDSPRYDATSFSCYYNGQGFVNHWVNPGAIFGVPSNLNADPSNDICVNDCGDTKVCKSDCSGCEDKIDNPTTGTDINLFSCKLKGAGVQDTQYQTPSANNPDPTNDMCRDDCPEGWTCEEGCIGCKETGGDQTYFSCREKGKGSKGTQYKIQSLYNQDPTNDVCLNNCPAGKKCKSDCSGCEISSTTGPGTSKGPGTTGSKTPLTPPGYGKTFSCIKDGASTVWFTGDNSMYQQVSAQNQDISNDQCKDDCKFIGKVCNPSCHCVDPTTTDVADGCGDGNVDTQGLSKEECGEPGLMCPNPSDICINCNCIPRTGTGGPGTGHPGTGPSSGTRPSSPAPGTIEINCGDNGGNPVDNQGNEVTDYSQNPHKYTCKPDCPAGQTCGGGCICKPSGTTGKPGPEVGKGEGSTEKSTGTETQEQNAQSNSATDSESVWQNMLDWLKENL